MTWTWDVEERGPLAGKEVGFPGAFKELLAEALEAWLLESGVGRQDTDSGPDMQEVQG